MFTEINESYVVKSRGSLSKESIAAFKAFVSHCENECGDTTDDLNTFIQEYRNEAGITDTIELYHSAD